MKITTEQYNVMKLIAEDIVASNSFNESLRRNLAPRTYTVFHAEGTKSAVLLALIKAVEEGKELMHYVAKKDVQPAASNEVDEFTAEAIAKIPPGKPDAATLKRPKGDVFVKVVAENLPEGHAWADDKGRHWKIVDGKKRQQKKPKADGKA